MLTELLIPSNLDKAVVDWITRNQGDPDKMVQTFFMIKNKHGEVVKFKYNLAQRLHKERSSQFDRILKSRKAGISSKRIASDLIICATRKNQHRIALTHTGEAANIMMSEKVNPFIKNCIYPLNAVMRKDYIHFPLTDSRYYFGTAGAVRFGRGDDITGKHFMETAHWDDPDVMVGVDEGLIDNADGLDETTAHGHNFWKKLWETSKRGQNKDKAIFLPWYVCEDYRRDPAFEPGPISEEEHNIMTAFKLDAEQISWRRWKKRTMQDPSLFPQEYPETDEEAFLSSGRPVFDKIALAYCRQTVSEPKWRGYLIQDQSQIKFVPQANADLRIWKMPERDHVYAIGADVAEGIKDGCYSTGEVLDIGDSEQVAEWVGHISPDIFADVLIFLAYFYNQATIVPESWPGPGEVTTSHLLEKRAKVWVNSQEGDRHGFHTTAHTKIAMISSFNGALRDYRLTIRSAELLDELHAYVYSEPKSNRYQNMTMESSLGNYSDRLMAMGIAWHCTRDVADRVDYYSPVKIQSVLGMRPGGNGVSVPRFTGPRFGVHSK